MSTTAPNIPIEPPNFTIYGVTGLNINGKLLCTDTISDLTQTTSSKIKHNNSNIAKGTKFIANKGQLPLSRYCKNLDNDIAINGSVCVGGNWTWSGSTGTYYIWYRKDDKTIRIQSGGSKPSYNSNGHASYTLKFNSNSNVSDSTPEYAKIWVLLQGAGGGGQGGYRPVLSPVSYSGLGGSSGGTALFPIHLKGARSWDSSTSFSVLRVDVGGGGAGGPGQRTNNSNGATGGSTSAYIYPPGSNSPIKLLNVLGGAGGGLYYTYTGNGGGFINEDYISELNKLEPLVSYGVTTPLWKWNGAHYSGNLSISGIPTVDKNYAGGSSSRYYTNGSGDRGGAPSFFGNGPDTGGAGNYGAGGASGKGNNSGGSGGNGLVCICL